MQYQRKSKKGTIFLVRKKEKQMLKSQAFDAYKQGKPGLLEKLGVWENRRTQPNRYL